MKESEYQKLKEVIWKANPSILELKFGCYITTEHKFIGDKKYRYKGVIYRNTNNDDDGDFDHHKDYKNPLLRVVYGCFGGECKTKYKDVRKSEIIEILGRPIRLDDIIIAIRKNELSDTKISNESNLLDKWNLKDNNLDNQEKETKSWLIDLLIK